MTNTARQTGRTALVLAVAAALLVASVAPAAAARDDEDDDSDLLFTITERAANADLSAAASGLFGGRLASLSATGEKLYRIATGEEPNATRQANRLQSFVNEHNASLVAHTNRVLDEYNATVRSTDYVLKFSVGEETRYLVTSANGENVTSATVRASKPANLSVDRSKALDAFEAEDLNADLRAYREEYVATDEIPPLQYYVEHAAKYGVISEIAMNESSGWF